MSSLGTKETSQPAARADIVSVLLMLVGIISLASLLLLIQTSRVATAGYDLQRLEEIKSGWQQRNYQLESEIAALQALDRIEQAAKTRLKMLPATQYVYVTVGKPSQGQSQVPTPHQAAQQPEAHPVPWWQKAVNTIRFW